MESVAKLITNLRKVLYQNYWWFIRKKSSASDNNPTIAFTIINYEQLNVKYLWKFTLFLRSCVYIPSEQTRVWDVLGSATLQVKYYLKNISHKNISIQRHDASLGRRTCPAMCWHQTFIITSILSQSKSKSKVKVQSQSLKSKFKGPVQKSNSKV